MLGMALHGKRHHLHCSGVLTNTVAKEVTYMNLVHTAGTPKFKVVFSVSA